MQAERHQATTRTKAPGTTVGTLSAIVKFDEASDENMTIDRITSSKDTFYGLVFLKDYAKQREQPMVVSMSLGTNTGSHNGKGEITEAVEAIC